MACKGVRMLYGTAQNWWDCVGVDQMESRLLKFLFITLIWSSCWHDLSPNHTQASSWMVLVGTGRNTAMEQAKNEAVCTVRDPSHALSRSFSILVKKRKAFLFFPDNVKWEDYLPSFRSVHRTGKLSSCLMLPAGLTFFSLENGLKNHRLNLHYALCKNLCLPYVKQFWSETSGLVSN